MALTPDYAGVRADVATGLAKWRIWTRAGWYEVRRRYRRTVLGPLWNTISLGVLALAMAYIWAPLMNANLQEFLPHVLTGVVCWSFMAGMMNDGGMLFIGGESLLKQLKFPLMILVLTAIWRNIIIFLHNMVVVALVVVVLDVPVNFNTLLLIPGVFLFALNALWYMPFLALLSVRFRDIPPVVGNILTVFYFITPVFWRPEQMASQSFIYEYNPLHHLMDMIRSPLVGEAPELVSYFVVVTMAVIGAAITFVAFAYLKRRVPYWL